MYEYTSVKLNILFPATEFLKVLKAILMVHRKLAAGKMAHFASQYSGSMNGDYKQTSLLCIGEWITVKDRHYPNHVCLKQFQWDFYQRATLFT